jgi:hypothetical protein
VKDYSRKPECVGLSGRRTWNGKPDPQGHAPIIIKIKTMLTIKTYPFTASQLNFFESEINEAGDFDELMLKKGALKRDRDMIYIANRVNVEAYKQKHLTGEYEALRPMYDTEVPYTFWGFLYSALQKRGSKSI